MFSLVDENIVTYANFASGTLSGPLRVPPCNVFL